MDSIILQNGTEIYKRCLSCQHATAYNEKYVNCECEGIPVEKNLCCCAYEVHRKFNRIGNHPGGVKPKEYYDWQLSLIRKCTRGKDTDWDKFDEMIKPFKVDMYKYWLKNIKGKKNG